MHKRLTFSSAIASTVLMTSVTTAGDILPEYNYFDQDKLILLVLEPKPDHEFVQSTALAEQLNEALFKQKVATVAGEGCSPVRRWRHVGSWVLCVLGIEK